jgi:four helix bundle protein
MNNIAEGFERKTNSEFKQFIYVAKGSCGELRSMIYLAKSLKYLSDENTSVLLKKSTEISKILSGLIKTLYELYNFITL